MIVQTLLIALSMASSDLKKAKTKKLKIKIGVCANIEQKPHGASLRHFFESLYSRTFLQYQTEDYSDNLTSDYSIYY